jgi:hypothetical protein
VCFVRIASLVLLERKFLKFHFKEVIPLSLACFYVIMMLKCCLKLLVLVLARLCSNLGKVSAYLGLT